MGLDGARSATRRWLECGTCATRVTRGTFDFQARDRFELCDKEFARNLLGAERQSSFQSKLVPRVTRVAHVTRRSKIQVRSSINLASKPPFRRRAPKQLSKQVSPTRHTRRTRRTPELNSSAKLHQSGFKAALQSAFSRAGGAMPNRAIAHYFPP